MRVLLPSERSEEHLAVIAAAVAGGVGEVPDVRDAPRNTAILVLRFVPRQDAGGNIQPVRKVDDLVRHPVTIGVLENLDGITAVANPRAPRIGPALLLGRIGILHGRRDPEPPALVVSEVDGLVDHGLRGEELDLEAGGNLESLLFLLRGERLGLADEGRISGCRNGPSEENQKCRSDRGPGCDAKAIHDR